MDDRKSQPLYIVVLLALLGMFTLPRGLTPGQSSSNSAAPKATPAADGSPVNQPATTAPQAIENPDLDILGAIIYLTNDGSTARVMDRAERPRTDRLRAGDALAFSTDLCCRQPARNREGQAQSAPAHVWGA